MSPDYSLQKFYKSPQPYDTRNVIPNGWNLSDIPGRSEPIQNGSFASKPVEINVDFASGETILIEEIDYYFDFHFSPTRDLWSPF